LSWSNVFPGETVTGSFTVENIGEPGSELDWEITDYPSWGTWSFNPSSGQNLKPEDGPVTVQVEVVAPNQPEQTFTGLVTIENQEDSSDYDTINAYMATITAVPDLEVEGTLTWYDVEPGDTVTKDIYVKNVGDPGSELDWEITDWPTWGTWSFNPSSGQNLKPEDGPVTIQVTVVAPNQPEQTFTGVVMIVNLEDSGDHCIINVILETTIFNDPPNKPTITGPTNGEAGQSYDYDFIAIDPDGNDIRFYIKWGDGFEDGWLGPYASGTAITKSHTWSDEGYYTIEAKAKDIHDEESEWGTLTVSMPFNQQVVQQNIQSLQQRIIQLFSSPLSLESANDKEIKTNAPKDTSTEIQGSSKSRVDWWPRFHHDIMSSGFSSSSAPNTANIIWSRNLDSQSAFWSSPAIVDDKLYVGCAGYPGHGKIFCLDTLTGDIAWEYNTGDTIWSSPAVYDNKVYVGSWDKSVYCLNAVNGDYIWSYETGDRIYDSPIVDNDRLYVGSFDGNYYCFDADPSDGVDEGYNDPSGVEYDIIWIFSISGNPSSGALAYGYIYISGAGIYCLNSATGSVVWQEVGYPPAVDNGKIYTTSGDTIYCYNAYNGNEIWNTASPTSDCSASTPAVAYGYVYVGCGDDICCFDADTGSLEWSSGGGYYYRSSPAVADGKVYIGSYGTYKLYCFDANNGNELWSKNAGGWIESSPAIADGIVYLANGHVYAFRDNDPPDEPSNPVPSDDATDV